eukprot:CAMPEP_0184443734 /NCGR_PEP_ID=MMETSP0740-20130409/707_1 /TAXON_ID=385413 /ORGANISM="Thalassiosira miniscula, Strain CCMP1093" /LENGTH=214 /DNA_ID=CAMNT_0026812155 /DNA_START=71 /DNA_END=715 /DNA_ORIENTATION=+
MRPSLRNTRRNRPNSRPVSTNISQVRGLRTKLNGSSLRVRPDPTPVVDRPWNNITLSFRSENSGTLSLKTITDAFNRQAFAGIANSLPLEFRLQQMRLWELEGGALSVEIYDLNGAAETISSQKDVAGRNHWSSVGFMWPIASTNNTLPSSSTTLPIAYIAADSSSPDIEIHVKLLWRVAGPTVTSFNELVIKQTKNETINDEPQVLLDNPITG